MFRGRRVSDHKLRVDGTSPLPVLQPSTKDCLGAQLRTLRLAVPSCAYSPLGFLGVPALK